MAWKANDPSRVPNLSQPDAEIVSLDTLVQYESIQLFIERAQTAIPGFCLSQENATYLTRVSRRLDGIPLAIELAAARMRILRVEQIAALDLRGIAIGGLSVGETNEVFRETLAQTAPLLPRDVPHYLMGIGTPDYIFDAVSAGIDMFDCVFPTRIARNGTVLTWDGRLVLRNEKHKTSQEPIDTACECAVCRRYSRSYLRHLFKSGEMLGPILATEHNLHFLGELVAGIRSSIREGRYTAYRDATLARYNDGERLRQDADSEISE